MGFGAEDEGRWRGSFPLLEAQECQQGLGHQLEPLDLGGVGWAWGLGTGSRPGTVMATLTGEPWATEWASGHAVCCHRPASQPASLVGGPDVVFWKDLCLFAHRVVCLRSELTGARPLGAWVPCACLSPWHVHVGMRRKYHC